MEVRLGKGHDAAKGLPGLWQTLEKLPCEQWPTFIRGDCGYGNEAIMLDHEERKLPYLVKLRHTKKVKDLVQRMHYRDRADAENCLDELKNQWDWGGYISRRLVSSNLMANLIALFYNWWSIYLRFHDEGHHREAIRTRPRLMAGVGQQVQSGGQRTVKVSILHKGGTLNTQTVTLISKGNYSGIKKT